MRVFYPVSQVTELSAGYRYTTPRSAESAATGPSRGAAPVATPAWSSPHAANTAPPTIRGHPVPPCATAPAPLHSFVECFGPRPTPFSTPVCAQSRTKHSPKGLFRAPKWAKHGQCCGGATPPGTVSGCVCNTWARGDTRHRRLWQQQGKREAAYELLAQVYNWFTEGFDTADLQEAKALEEFQ